MLLGNYSVLNNNPGRAFGGSTVSNTRAQFNKSGPARGRFLHMAKFNAVPSGYVVPYCYVISQSSGGMACFRGILSSGGISAGNLAGGLNATSPLTGSGDITNAALGLILSAVAALTGSATLSADILGKLEAAAALAGSGDITAALGALAGLAAGLTGTGTSTADATAKAFLSSDIVVTGDILSTANIGDAVWARVIESGITAEEVVRILLAVAAGKSEVTDLGGGAATVVFRDQADALDRVTATMASSDRTAVVIDAS
jgi:hypothetical protein